MSISVTCPSCQYQFAVPPEFAGKRGKCPKCATVFVAAAPEVKPLPPVANAPPARLKTAAPLPAVAAPAVGAAPAKPAPRPAAPAPRTSDTVRASDTATSNSQFNFSIAPTAPTVSSPTTSTTSTSTRRGHKKGDPNTGLFIALGAGGGLLALAIIIGGVFAFSSGDTKKPGVAKNSSSSKTKSKTGSNKTSNEVEPDDDKGGGLLERPRTPVTVVAAKPREARSLEDVVDGVVKIETSSFEGTSLGTGFIINEKGWIATNCHVLENATDQTVVVMKNSKYKIAGLVAKAPEHDMAIIKLAEQPFQLTVLDISYSQHPKLASRVRTVGFPDDVFNLTEGIVSNVTTTDGLNDRQRAFVLQAMQGANNHLWIQHSAKISPGNSGGPLLNDENQVIGINTWVSANIDVGYAGHVNHLRDLIATASDNVTPFPKGLAVEIADADAMINTVPTAARVNQLIAFCAKFQWKPTTLDEFDAMAELAKLVTMVRLAKGSGPPRDLVQATDEAVKLMGGLTWDADQVQKINTFAAEATSKPMHGIIFVATMVEPNAKFGDNFNADRMQLEGNSHPVIVKSPNNRALSGKDKRLLIIGMNMPAALVKTDESASQRLIVPGYSKELK